MQSALDTFARAFIRGFVHIQDLSMPLDKSGCIQNNFLISQLRHVVNL